MKYLLNDRNISIFVLSISDKAVKYSEFIKKIKKQGWVFLRQGKGSHEIYVKDGKMETIPNHGSREMSKGLERTLSKRMKIK